MIVSNHRTETHAVIEIEGRTNTIGRSPVATTAGRDAISGTLVR